MKTIALLDDRENIRVSYGALFRAEGYDVHTFSSGTDLINALPELKADLILLDIDLGGRFDGWRVQEIIGREHPEQRVIFMTAVAVKEADEARGLEAGAADYIRKGSDPRVMLARVRRELFPRPDLRREEPEEADAAERIVAGDLVLDMPGLACTWKGREVAITVTEFTILAEMAASPGRVKSRDQLLAVAGRIDHDVSERAIDSHMKRIRRKIRDVDPSFDGIQTRNGAGYRYCLDPGA